MRKAGIRFRIAIGIVCHGSRLFLISRLDLATDGRAQQGYGSRSADHPEPRRMARRPICSRERKPQVGASLIVVHKARASVIRRLPASSFS
jgi:hypothetical protein